MNGKGDARRPMTISQALYDENWNRVFMRIIRTRDELMQWAERLAPTAACARAVREGRAINLGGYTLPDLAPMYVVRVKCEHGAEYIYGIRLGESRYHRHLLDAVPPLRYWDGKPGSNTIVDGDADAESTR